MSADKQGQSAASVRPAARTAIRRLYDLDESMGAWIRAGDGENTCTIKDEWVITGQEIIGQAIKALEAQPAAERTALKELRKKVEHGPWITLYDCQDCGQLLTSTLYQIHNADHTVITLNYIDRMAMLAEIDAQERAGAQA